MSCDTRLHTIYYIIHTTTAASYVNMTSKCALHRHRALEIAGLRNYFRPSRSPPPDARMRVVTFVISTFGCFGAQAQALIKDIGRRTNLFVPPSLAHEISWATMSINTFIRSALTFQVRKRVAVNQSCSVNIFQMTFSPLLSKHQTPLTASDQGNLVGNFLA